MHANWPFTVGVCVCVYNILHTIGCCDDELSRPGSTFIDLSGVLHSHKLLPWVTSSPVGQSLVGWERPEPSKTSHESAKP